jgi:hypothetical protein
VQHLPKPPENNE